MSDYDSYRSPWPDGINFGFIKDFLLKLKDDFMLFLSKLYRNGKLTKGLKNTFIALIPNVESPQCLADFLVGCLYKVIVKVIENKLRSEIGR